jgi:hypothetical protein
LPAIGLLDGVGLHLRGRQELMLQANRRMTLKLLGGASLTIAGTAAFPGLASAQEDLVVPNTYQNFKRGTINSLHPERRIFNIVWEDLGRVKMRAADLVANYPQLKVGQIVDVSWYDYLDFLITKKTPESEARAKAMLAQGARLEGIPGAQEPIRLWSMSGMVTKVDAPGSVLYLINASGGRPEEPAPDSGEVIQLPPALTDRLWLASSRATRSSRCGASRRRSKRPSSARETEGACLPTRKRGEVARRAGGVMTPSVGVKRRHLPNFVGEEIAQSRLP